MSATTVMFLNIGDHTDPNAVNLMTDLNEGTADWQWDIESDTVNWSEELYRIAGDDPGTKLPPFREHSRFYTSESWDRLVVAVLKVFTSREPYEIELQMVRPDGTIRWIVSSGEAVRDPSDRILRLRGSVEEITDRRFPSAQIQRSVTKSRRITRSSDNALIDRYEQEMERISRELTEHVCQSLSLIAVKVQQLRHAIQGCTTDEQMAIHETSQQLDETLSNVYWLSQELRPSALDLIGLDGVIRGLCRRYSEQSTIPVECTTSVILHIEARLALAFFRICQTALHGIERDGRVKSIAIELTTSGNCLVLRATLYGDGVEFQAEDANPITGLGCASINEQLRLVRGELIVWSHPHFAIGFEARARL